jgi:hypothetical protein
MRVLEKINGPFLYSEGGSPAEYGAGSRTRRGAEFPS